MNLPPPPLSLPIGCRVLTICLLGALVLVLFVALVAMLLFVLGVMFLMGFRFVAGIWFWGTVFASCSPF